MPLYLSHANDTPSRVARRFSLSAEELCCLNALDDPRRLTEGLALLLPEEPAAPLRALELLGCPYEPLPAAHRVALLPGLSWWAGDRPEDARGAGAVPLLLHANWTAEGWSAEAAHTLLQEPKTADTLLQRVLAGGYGGLYLLLGGVPAFDAPALRALAEALATELHAAGRYLLLGLDAAESAFFPMGEAADRVVLLSPGQAPSGPLPRPNAPLEALAEQLEQALRVLPAARTLLGLSGYGTLWAGGEAMPLSHTAAVHLAVSAGAPIRWDADSGECSFRCPDACGQPRTVWFQDLRSLRARLALVDALGLAGLALQPAALLNRPGWEYLHRRYEIKTIASG